MEFKHNINNRLNMKKILLSSIAATIFFPSITAFANSDPDRTYLFTFKNSSEKSAYIRGHAPNTWTSKTDGGSTYKYSVDERVHPNQNFPFRFEMWESPHGTPEYRIILGKEYEIRGCRDYEINMEFNPPRQLKVLNARCLK